MLRMSVNFAFMKRNVGGGSHKDVGGFNQNLSLPCVIGADGHVTVWDLGMGHILCRYPPPPLLTLDDSRDQEDLPVGAVSGLSFSQDGALLAISLNNHLRAYDTRRFAPTFGDR